MEKSKFKGTPAPWTYYPNPYFYEIRGADPTTGDKVVVNVSLFDRDNESLSLLDMNHANARLMSKAPDLLFLLEEIDQEITRTNKISPDTRKKIHEMIQNATDISQTKKNPYI